MANRARETGFAWRQAQRHFEGSEPGKGELHGGGHVSLPNKPAGLTIKTMTMMTNTTILEASG